MSGTKGYKAVQHLRTRAESKRGGHTLQEEDFIRDGQSLAFHVERFLDHMRILNRTDKAVRSQSNSLKYFLRWSHERDYIYPDQINHAALESYQRTLFRYRKANGKPLSVSSQRGRRWKRGPGSQG